MQEWMASGIQIVEASVHRGVIKSKTNATHDDGIEPPTG
jgi:hypothetical protein